MSQYYYLVTGLPELSLDDNKLNYTVGDFKTEFYPQLSKEDQQLVDLYYLKFDNANLLKLLKDREAVIDPRGNFTADQFVAVFKQFDEEGFDLIGPEGFGRRFVETVFLLDDHGIMP